MPSDSGSRDGSEAPANSRPPSPSPPPPPPSLPPQEQPPRPVSLNKPPQNHRLLRGPPYDTYEELAADLSAFAKSQGFHFSIQRRKKLRSGRPIRVDLYCDRSRFRATRGQGIRATATRKVPECTWRAWATSKSHDDWKWTIRFEGEHKGHGPSDNLAEHAGARRFNDEQKAYIHQLFDVPGIPNRVIAETLRRRWPDHVFIDKDLSNLRSRHNMGQVGGSTSIQALSKRFERQGVKHTVRHDPSTPDEPTGIVWTYPWCEDMWRRFPFVLYLDSSRNSSRPGMALLEAVITTNIGSAAPACFALVENEAEDCYSWFFTELDSLRKWYGIPEPGIIITEDDTTLKSAVTAVFPKASQQLRRHPINKNVGRGVRLRVVELTANTYRQWLPLAEE